MDGILERVSQGVEQLLGRAGGPLHFRLFMMPTVVTILAIRAGMQDAREGRPIFFWTLLTNRVERKRHIRSGLKDVGRIFLVAIAMDTLYQLWVLRGFYVGQLLIVAVACAIVPYLVIRGPIGVLMRRLYRSQAGRGRD